MNVDVVGAVYDDVVCDDVVGGTVESVDGAKVITLMYGREVEAVVDMQCLFCERVRCGLGPLFLDCVVVFGLAVWVFVDGVGGGWAVEGEAAEDGCGRVGFSVGVEGSADVAVDVDV